MLFVNCSFLLSNCQTSHSYMAHNTINEYNYHIKFIEISKEWYFYFILAVIITMNVFSNAKI